MGDCENVKKYIQSLKIRIDEDTSEDEEDNDEVEDEGFDDSD